MVAKIFGVAVNVRGIVSIRYKPNSIWELRMALMGNLFSNPSVDVVSIKKPKAFVLAIRARMRCMAIYAKLGLVMAQCLWIVIVH